MKYKEDMTTPKACRFLLYIYIIISYIYERKQTTGRVTLSMASRLKRGDHERRDEGVAREEPPAKKGGPGQEAMRLA